MITTELNGTSTLWKKKLYQKNQSEQQQQTQITSNGKKLQKHSSFIFTCLFFNWMVLYNCDQKIKSMMAIHHKRK